MNCPAYVKKETVTPKQAAEIIRKAGGKVVLAHPIAYKYEDNLSQKETLEIINDIKADGIEAIYIYIDKNNKIINEINEWKDFAKRNNLLITIGSDFHIKDGKHAEIGLENVNVKLNQEEINDIIRNLKK